MSALRIVSDEPNTEWATFETFWELFPRRVARKDAMKAWAKLSDADREAAITGLVAWGKVWRARGELQYVPYPSTFLNGERWTDELPVEIANRPASHAPVLAKPDVPRGEMPQSVRDAIARLKR